MIPWLLLSKAGCSVGIPEQTSAYCERSSGQNLEMLDVEAEPVEPVAKSVHLIQRSVDCVTSDIARAVCFGELDNLLG
jgi:hypothetical protein